MIGNPNTQRYNLGRGAGLAAPSTAQSQILLQRVCYMLASGLFVSALAAYVLSSLPIETVSAFFFPLVIATFGLLFLMRAVARKPGLNVFVFYLFCAAEGALLTPLLMTYVRDIGPGIVWEAFILTAITVAAVGGYAYTSGKDFGFLGKTLFWALAGVIVVGILSWFVIGLNTPVMILGFESIVVAVFVGFLLYDFSNIRLRYSPDDYIMASVAVYLDFVNLFLAILRILSVLNGGGGGSSRRN